MKTSAPRRDGLAEFLRTHPHPGGIIVSEKHRFIYMKACRTAGTSILRKTFEQKLRVDLFHFRDHRDRFDHWLSQITDEQLEEYQIFTFVRNPWDRAVSIASYFNICFHDFAKDFQRLTAANEDLAQHSLPLHLYAYSGAINFTDFVGRFENLQADCDKLLQMLGFPKQIIPHANRSQRTHYQDYYDSETKQLVDVIYARDRDLFGYEY